MRKKVKIISLVLLVTAGITAVFFYKEYMRKPQTALDLSSDYKITAESLMKEFTDNEEQALKKYTDKVIEVKGIIETVNNNGEEIDVVIETSDPMTAVNVQLLPEMKNKINTLKPGNEITLKGILKGKLSDIELNRGAIIE